MLTVWSCEAESEVLIVRSAEKKRNNPISITSNSPMKTQVNKKDFFYQIMVNQCDAHMFLQACQHSTSQNFVKCF